MHYLEGLNERQKEAVLHTDGPLLIVAGAGAGKTKTITHRIARLIAEGVPARQILAVTFTNKAAQEMKIRIHDLLHDNQENARALPAGRHGVRALVPASAGSPLVATFHSLGVRILREFHKEAGLPRGFAIWDRDDSVRAVKRAMEGFGIEEPTPRAALSAISRAKGDGQTPAEYAASARNPRGRAVARVWEAYERVLSDEGALDFDDLLSRTLALLERDERVRHLLAERWIYLTIDEYQDTNRIQYEIARLLAAPRNNICVVGDIDQNIYSWRGADIAHLLSFERSFPGTKVVLLEQNYRSTRTILSAANGVIAKNSRRLEKNLFTDNGVGEPIVLFAARNEIDEAWFIAATSKGLIEAGTDPGEIAVLYRENFQSRAIEEAMLHLDVPYRVIGTRFFQRKEVKDALSYLRAALNPGSRSDLSRIAGTPARGIGATTLEKMFSGAPIAGAAQQKVARFRQTIEAIGKAVATLPASEALRFALTESGLERMHQEGGDEGRERWENVLELVNVAARYDFDEPPEGIEHLLEQAALESDQDELPEARSAVSLLTVHASKGLEFDAVFVSGLEQGLFPSTREAEGKERDPEEERRLFYVALTRARLRLFLTYARERARWGSREYTLPSEFLEDIDQRLVQSIERERGLLDDDEDVIR